MRAEIRNLMMGVAAALALTFPAWAQPKPQPALVIEHVTVVPMTTGGSARSNATVIIENGRIAAIGGGELRPPEGARRIDGRGKWLMPGLADMHVHIENDRMIKVVLNHWVPGNQIPPARVDLEHMYAPYIANGVTQVLTMSAMSETVGQRDSIETGRVVGPHIAMAAMIDGAPAIWPVGMTRVATNPAEGRQAVRDAHAEGYDFVKTYSRLDLETFTAIVDEARKLNMKVAGHIPGRNESQTQAFFQPGYALVAHAEEYAYQSKARSDADIQRFAEIAKANNTWLVATLITDRRILDQMRDPSILKAPAGVAYVNPTLHGVWLNANPYTRQITPQRIAGIEQVVAFNDRLAKAFADAGIPVLAGTDTLVSGLIPGYALHEELEFLAKAGLSNRQILEGATRQSAEWLGVAADRGTVEPGKRADLILLTADPQLDVANTRKIAGVFLSGRYFPRAELQQRLDELARRHAAMPAVNPMAGLVKTGGHFGEDE